MNTFKQFSVARETIPTITSWYLADLGQARGKQELFIRQSPQRLKMLREHALVESAVSSNRIEGVIVDQARVATVVFGKSPLRDRNEEEVRGYREALRIIHEKKSQLAISEKTILDLYRAIRGDIGDAGKYKERNSDIIEKFADGSQRLRFKTVAAEKTSAALSELLSLWQQCLDEKWLPPLIALAAFNLDFLCIHPFRDGNGRVSRLLLLLQCYHLGYEVGRYISLERLIEENKERYYETLEESSRRWHEGKHNPWPYINYILYVLKSAYQKFENRLESIKSPRGAKTELIITAVRTIAGEFSLSELERMCPGVSRDLVRRVLRQLQKAKVVDCLGRGPGALWKKKGNTL